MRLVTAALAILVLLMVFPTTIFGQSAPPSPTGSVPRLIFLSGVFQPVDGRPPAPVEGVTLSIYSDPEGGAPLWQETQNVAVDDKGRYALLLGASQADGIPAAVWAAGAQWLGTRFERIGEVEGPRVRLTSVPYALRAADADTLGGQPASAYMLAPPTAAGDRGTGTTSGSPGTKSVTAGAGSTGSTPTSSQTNDVLPGTANFVAKYVSGVDVGPGVLYDTGTAVGLATTAPRDYLDVHFTNTGGTATGFAVQNLGNTAASYSGMLFYDQNGNVGQFQGFNNLTHEYRINNVAQNGSSQFNGSINFMIGHVPRFLVTAGGNIGIGTTTPIGILDVSNALIPAFGVADINATTYGNNSFGSVLGGRKARGTAGAPSGVLNGDALAIVGGRGYGATGFSGFVSGLTVTAAEAWTDTAQGTFMNFTTTPKGTTQPVVRMTLDFNGNLGVGTTFPNLSGLEVSNATTGAATGIVTATSYTGSNPSGSLFIGRHARGTSGAPSAILNGDALVGFLSQGYGATGFSGTRGGMFVRAAENWTDIAQGTSLAFNTTASGTTSPSTKMTIDSFGDVGIGTPFPPHAPLEVSRTGADAAVMVSEYANGTGHNPVFLTQFARGTPGAPTATQSGDVLGAFVTTGFGATQFGDVTGGMGVIAQENWTDAAQGTATGLLATPLGSNSPHLYMAVVPSGNVGIGDWTLPNPVPTATDKLQVFGDIRVGTTGTNGCLKSFDGTALAGTCASDRRFKKNITPFGHVLDQLTALQPVHYFWRAAEFPERHFGDAQSYGLIAQDVETVLPELVVTGEDGFKAVDYSKLPLLTVQAVKELEAEVLDLKTENEALKNRLGELERTLKDLLAATPRR
jgi:hypothetical protein